ncbi:SRPBCC family protein [Lentzea sp. NBRC 102530]|uniref:SRPBCC family protein n=1 Tax=Lentzea sp. NBRC 102530 TaxID=3032201 RepID=UPI0024A1C5AE|nr:SRPBCC family protein [Lentzea sp. NBRC 102530]GLY54549.1 ATPase [Lentzea sp. NBRC 102530]
MTEVRRSVLVNAGADHAFKVFTEKFVTWWPAAHHISDAALEDVVVEPRAGGRWYEVDQNGAECDWGRVKAWEPPSRLLLAWHLDGDWDYDPDPARASEVEITFTAEGDGTRVELVHRDFERHFVKPERVRDGVGGEGGWGGILLGFRGAFV